MDRTYAIALLLFIIACFALIGLFLWQLFSGRLRPHRNFGRGFEPVFPLDPKNVANGKVDAARAGAVVPQAPVPDGTEV